jgi:hypothetical protein
MKVVTVVLSKGILASRSYRPMPLLLIARQIIFSLVKPLH